jgi:hypothetical protein
MARLSRYLRRGLGLFRRAGRVPPPEFYPITERRLQDIYLVAYPRSGATWFQNLAAGVAFGAIPEWAPDTLVQELVPDLHYKRFYKRFRESMIFKSHHLPRPDHHRVVYLLRDGRDVMVSYFHYLRALGNRCDFLDMVRSGAGLFPCKWHAHVEAWKRNPFAADVLRIKYEDLRRDPQAQLRRFCAFAEVDRSDEFLHQVAQSASFEKLKRKERDTGWDNPLWPKDQPFLRRGAAGSYVEEMPTEVLQAFLEEAAGTLKEQGYGATHVEP